MIHTKIEKERYNDLSTEVLVEIILNRDDKITLLQTKLRQIEQYLDDLDDIDYKTMKYEIEKILGKI